MRMRLHLPLFATVTTFLALPTAFILRVSAEPLRLVTADERGVTLRLDGPEFKLAPTGAGGIATLEAVGLDRVSPAGRPQLPIAAALIAVPPHARVTARVMGDEGEQLTEGVRLP